MAALSLAVGASGTRWLPQWTRRLRFCLHLKAMGRAPLASIVAATAPNTRYQNQIMKTCNRQCSVGINIICCLVLPLLVSGALTSYGQYLAYDLGSLDGGSSAAYGISSVGTIVGWSSTSGGGTHAVTFSGGGINDLGTLGGFHSEALGVNAGGVLVGSSMTSLGNWHAFISSGGAMTDLGTLGGSQSFGRGINAAGTVVGESVNSGGSYHAFRYQGGVMTDLGTLGGGFSEALAINDVGTVVGYSYMSYPLAHAFSYSSGVMTDLGTLDTTGGPAGSSRAYGINAAGTIVGSSSTGDGHAHAFSYIAGVMHDLGSLNGGNSAAYGIKTAGVIVGEASTSGLTAWHAFVHKDGTMTDLSPFLADVGLIGDSNALAIGDNGDIVGYASTAGGQTHAFLLTVVPEPSIFALAALGGTLMLFRRATKGQR